MGVQWCYIFNVRSENHHQNLPLERERESNLVFHVAIFRSTTAGSDSGSSCPLSAACERRKRGWSGGVNTCTSTELLQTPSHASEPQIVACSLTPGLGFVWSPLCLSLLTAQFSAQNRSTRVFFFCCKFVRRRATAGSSLGLEPHLGAHLLRTLRTITHRCGE